MKATTDGPGSDNSANKNSGSRNTASRKNSVANSGPKNPAPRVVVPSSTKTSPTEATTRRQWPLVLLLVAIVAAIYGSRLTTLPIRGEEPRRARVAVEILATGDWIVPRQQGQIYTSRPPLQNAAIAAVGYLHGRVDLFAARLPSVLAVVATTLLIYFYTSRFLSRSAAFVAALAYPTMGQVLEIGRLAETEAFFTLLVSASLLVWHGGMMRAAATRGSAWSQALPWVAGYALAALASLAKGAQGTVYFIGSVVLYLALTRDWRNLFSRAHAWGVLAFVVILGAWQVPYLLATNVQSVKGIWTGLAAERYVNNTPAAVASHLLGYPLEVLACMLPWSLLLIAFAFRSFRRAVAPYRSQLVFLATCVAVTFLPVWVATHAKSRYYMPSYPLFAVLVGIVVDRLTAASDLHWLWRNYVRGVACAAAVLAFAVAVASWTPVESFGRFAQPLGLVVVLLAACGVTVVAAWRMGSWHESRRVVQASVALAVLLGLFTTGVHTNMLMRVIPDPGPAIVAAKATLPTNAKLVSFGRLDSMLTYHFGDMIAVTEWPRHGSDLPQDADFFCFNCPANELPKLPFEYRTQASVAWGRSTSGAKDSLFVIGQRVSGVASTPADASNAPADVAGKPAAERQ